MEIDSIDAQRICLCGSFRFVEDMNAAAEYLRGVGRTCSKPSPDPNVAAGVRGCFGRIDAAGAVLVIDSGGYLGASVLLEIGYAYAKGKPVYLTCPSSEPAVMCFVSGVVGTIPQEA